ncbi:MAG: transketolase [Nitrospiraceae bacterium]|nr:transketolase [Nitrospiraceae bacterium]
MGKTEELSINAIRMLAVDAVEKAKSGHPGMPLGDAAMAYVLWTKALRHDPKNPAWANRDRFVLSAGHGSMLLYSLLHLTGYGISLSDIKDFRQWASKTPGHPEHCPECGIETTTGPLGQGFATGVGMAMAEKYLEKLFNKPGFPVVNYRVFGILSDGDMMEGVQSEAASVAGHLGLGNIVYLYSDNRITIEGKTDIAFTEDVAKRFEAYGWHVQKTNGYDLGGIEKAVKNAVNEKNRPSLIIARTMLAYGCPTLQGNPEAHGSPLGEKEIELLKKSCGWPTGKKFYVPRDVYSHMKKSAAKGTQAAAGWRQMMKRYAKRHPAQYELWQRLSAGKLLPEGFEKDIPEFKPDAGAMATRSASGKVLNAIATRMPNLLGGSADLAPSNNTYLKGQDDFLPGKPGRNIHFGVREHAMGAISNGMALSGMLVPYCGTFLVFSDFTKPSIRLSALMNTHVIYIFTHDSIGLGEDGPTHQPIEHLAALRAIPGLTVIRPADANETAQAWKLALEKNGPTCLILSREGLPVIDRNAKGFTPASGIERGGYVLLDCKGAPDIILIGSGAQVHLCVKAAQLLGEKGVKAKVVNMASFDLFESQTKAYKDKVLPASVSKRLFVEAGSPLGLHRYAGDKGEVLAMERFGASAPGKVVLEKFGFTPENVAARAMKLVKGK